MRLRFTGFMWDEGNVAKCQKHGVPLSDIETLLTSEKFVMIPDEAHSRTEERFAAIGRGEVSLRIFLVVFTMRDSGGISLLRPIAARFMHRKERKRYEEALAKIQD